MEYRAFGRTGLDVSAIGYGCWEIGGGYGHFDENEVVAAVQRALDLGINLFDTAEGYGYGQSERLLGKALGARRKEAIVVTKFGIYRPEGEWQRDSRREMALAAIDRSLKALGTDYVDVYLIHWPDRETPLEESMRALEEIVQAGKARFVGVSNFTPDQIETCMATRRVDIAQYGYHMFDRRLEREIFPKIEEHGIGLMTYGSLAHGLLAGAFTPETSFDEDDWRSNGIAFNIPLFTEEVFARNVAAVDELKPIAARHGKTVAHLALRWVLSNPVVSVALVGFRRPVEVEEGAASLDWSLDQETLDEINAVFDKHGVDTAPPVWVEAL
ncbi:MAG: aldo/keto reductase [Caldilineaceae bacterium]|nr:aldo/keto reductase [Caldilineaceae bacterium]MCY4115686.1 aldo/keto reductase [Caldilineaceae bacterium]